MTFIVISKYDDDFSRAYHRPPQAEMLDPEMVSHTKLKQGREQWLCTKNFKKFHSCQVHLDNKITAGFDANNYLCVPCSAKNQSVNIHSCLFTQ